MKGRPIAYETLLAYAAGELDETEADFVAAGLAADAEGAAVVARYSAVRDAVAGDVSVAPPVGLLARAKAIFPRRDVEASGLAARLRRVVAELAFDSRGGPVLAGYRGVGAGADYRLAYESEAGDIDLQLEPAADPAAPWRLLGQVGVDEETPGIRVALGRAGALAAETEADPHGVFATEVTAGTYELTVTLPTAVVVVPDLEVG